MKSLTLLRHAQSEPAQASMSDFDRPLDAKGRSDSRLIGATLRGLGSFDLVLTSPALRAIETLEGVAETQGGSLQPQHDQRIYLAAPTTLIEIIRATPRDTQKLLIVGHNPGLEQLGLLLAEDSEPRRRLERGLPTGGLIEIRFASGEWSEIGEGSGAIRRFLVPADLSKDA